MWCNTQWANLSMQAKQINLPLLPYFDTTTMLLSKEVNVRLWKQLVSHVLDVRRNALKAGLSPWAASSIPKEPLLFVHLLNEIEQVKLFNALGPEKAIYATPVLVNGITPEISWHSYLEGDNGDAGMYDKPFWSLGRH